MMNQKLESMGHDFSITRHVAIDFFKKCKGTLRREKYVPILSEEKRNRRVEWCESIQEKLNNNLIEFPFCCVDEKWFYPSSGRCQEKNIPIAEFEEDENTYIPHTGVSSRRNVVKVMFMGIIAPPANRLISWLGKNIPGWKNGKIGLHRVANKKYLSRRVKNQKFVPDAKLNHVIKMGEWRQLYAGESVVDITVGDFLDTIVDYFEIEEKISQKLTLSYNTVARTKIVTRNLSRMNDEEELLAGREIKNEDGTERPLTIDDLQLFVMYQAGDEVQDDCSCDSIYMRRIMPIVGEEIRNYFFWISRQSPIYLIIDNAGGHGTNETVEWYRKMLEEDFNIILKHQVPNSPETNLLDLGVWRSLQSAVENLSYQKRFDPDVLAQTVNDAWDKFPAKTIQKVYNRWVRVLELIKLDDGGNRYVEELRGKLTNDPTKTRKVDEDIAFAAAVKKIQDKKINQSIIS